jgi:hypothetical protein
MSCSIIFSFGSGKKNIFSNCFSVIGFDHETGKQSILGFKKGQNLHLLFNDYVVPFGKLAEDSIEIIFKSQRVAKNFNNTINKTCPSEWKVRSLEGMQILKLQDSQFDEYALHAILLESLSSRFLDISKLNQTDKEILLDLVSNIDDSLTQSLLVGIAKQPIIYDMNKCFAPLSEKAKTYLKTQKR